MGDAQGRVLVLMKMMKGPLWLRGTGSSVRCIRKDSFPHMSLYKSGSGLALTSQMNYMSFVVLFDVCIWKCGLTRLWWYTPLIAVLEEEAEESPSSRLAWPIECIPWTARDLQRNLVLRWAVVGGVYLNKNEITVI